MFVGMHGLCLPDAINTLDDSCFQHLLSMLTGQAQGIDLKRMTDPASSPQWAWLTTHLHREVSISVCDYSATKVGQAEQ
jgi:hypothetical protein